MLTKFTRLGFTFRCTLCKLKIEFVVKLIQMYIIFLPNLNILLICSSTKYLNNFKNKIVSVIFVNFY
ncbi:hypothetical protein AAJ76_3800025880 [Vairimorpha ceranae]|uniref:Uncharacterized protein n=1 Tax=Vairimorpha ceranae TaxID=40302 RepID=A0A0F9WBQ4_9MICR|nr:hypothetical protein AAJ76_3800025880 [Vairimorpha ceranae]KKO74946.1 hypothetical protein AAJ76_3800025880 [Vairimorpha ceranae]